jgi:uncharacterized membrane protein YkoI
MARVNTYNTDTDVSGNDKVLGSDIGGATKNYTLDSIGEYFTKNNVVSVAGQLSFSFQPTVGDVVAGDFYVNNGGASTGTNLSAITKFTISKKYADQTDLINMLNRVVDNKFLFVESRNQDVKAIYEVQSIADNADDSFLDVIVTSKEQSGSLTAGKVYSFAEYGGGGDLTYEHVQSAASTTWNVAHNLDKKPSVSIADSADNILYGEITHTDLNNLVITLSAATSGKAYIN